ncbi:hypothetical protein CKF54_07885 [Psittacicella hinzii]|uniref:ABM domain-containing protein n=2 Tax=Psittacicella hinzii TaxID=2028575 RepID=A0A3A1Y1E7_9GAMM|nr:hypothetical protein CKF54_07885 [Psittacicella hinzii]
MYVSFAKAEVSLKQLDTSNNEPILKISELDIVPEQELIFNQVLQLKMLTSLSGRHNILGMFALKDENNSRVSYLVELYADSATYSAYQVSPEQQNFDFNLRQMIASKPKETVLRSKYVYNKEAISSLAHNKVSFTEIEIKDKKEGEFQQRLMDLVEHAKSSISGVTTLYIAQSYEKSNIWYVITVFDTQKQYKNYLRSSIYRNLIAKDSTVVKRHNEVEVTANFLMGQRLVQINRFNYQP